MPETLLFVRCVPQPLALTALADLRRDRPGARIEVLSNNAAASAIATSGAADAVVAYPASAFGILPAGFRLILSLRRRRYDAVIVPFTRRGQEAFWNVARLALLFGGRETLWQSAEPAGASSWAPVSLRQWWASRPVVTRVRDGVARMLTVAALLMAYLVGMAGLTVLALVLLPFVWLRPAPQDGTGRTL